ncbi:exodeoxyribonuclease VII large subunit [Pseudomonas sp. HY7a-MNA-CIBAN-0227]|uniref:exodeoxyribonuclease VII large subunit n=1 Tax=Pseudomonas sp. HY7a-MNA-CIBAN-0227 TaxID=3140474 RepID=UPI00333479DF
MADIIDIRTAKRVAGTAPIKLEQDDFTVLTINASGADTNYEFNASEATRNVLVLGQTGSGKSTSIMLPAIQSFIQNDCPGLVLDIKADLYSAIHAIAKQNNKLDNIRFIGVHDFCEEINILASIKSTEQLKNILSSIKPYTSEQNSYWFYSGLMDVMDIVNIHKWYVEEVKKEEYRFSFKTINDYISIGTFTRKIVDDAVEEIDFAPESIANTIRKVMREPFSLYPKHAAGQPVSEEEVDVSQQKLWRSGQIANILSSLIKEPFHSKLFNDSNSKSLHDYIYEDGKMLVLTVPLEHESTGYIVSKLLREVYFKAVCQNEIDDLDNYKIGPKFNRYTALVIDEYQFYLNTEQQNGVITDDNWLSISRGYRNINLFATQSISSMYSKSQNIHAVNTIVQNFANKFFLTTSDPVTCEHAKFLTKDFASGGLVQDLMESVLLSPAAGKRVGVFRVSNNGGISFDAFDYGSNPASKYMNSDEFNTIKKQSADELKASGIKPVITHEELTYQIIATTEKSITTTNGNKKRISEFKATPLYLDIKSTLNEGMREDMTFESLVNKYILTPYNITFCEQSVAEMQLIAQKIKEHHANQKQTVMQYMHELNLTVSAIESYEIDVSGKDHLSAQEINDQHILSQHHHIDTAYNIYAEKISAIKKSKDRDLNIAVITHHGSLGYEDFKSRIAETKLAKISIQDYEKSLNDLEFRKTKEGVDVFKKLKWADVVCFVRGGGDLSHSSFKYYRNAGLVPCVKKINPNCTVITALGHAPNVFLADLFADHSFITPTDAAHFLNDFIAKYSETLYSIQHSSFLADELLSKPTELSPTADDYIKPTFKKKIMDLFKRS